MSLLLFLRAVGRVSPRAASSFLCALFLTSFGCNRPPSGPPPTLDLFFTSQVHGRLTPCGCFSGQFGGVSRLHTALDSLAFTNRFGLDVGNALEGTEDFHRIRHRHLTRTYASLGFVALNAGHVEASLTPANLRQLATNSAVPLISANILDRASGTPVLPPYLIVDRHGVRIAILGVVDPTGFSDPPAEGLAIEKIQTCLARVLPEVRPKADAIILLAHTDESTLTALASEFYELSLVLGGRVSQPAKALQRENRTLVHYTGNEGKSFGFVQLTFPPKSEPQVVHSDIVLLSDRYPENPTVLAAAASYRREIRQSRLDVDLPDRVQADQIPGRRQAPAFAGSDSCRPCHAAAFDVWQRSAHSHAFHSLAQRDADADPACIRCHTVGFGSPGGYRREMARTRLTDVGCESCHGPGGTHVAERQAGTPPNFHFRPLAAGDCTRCHQGEFSRPFNWDRLWPAIRH